MSSIQGWVGLSLPRWMARLSGFVLILVGLAWPAITMPASTSSAFSPGVVTLAPDLPVQAAVPPADDPIADTPPMGWNGFNRFYHAVNEARVEAEARALVISGMKAAGYEYVNLDGGWDLPKRDVAGELQPDPAKFPNGIKPVAAYVHSLGLKFGIYTSAGTMNCAHTSAGSYRHETQDAATFASWGVDYLKLDWCYIPYHEFPHMSHQQVAVELAARMAAAIHATGRSILFDVNDWSDHSPGTWARGVAHVWRTTHDSQDHWWSLLLNFRNNVPLYKLAGPGGWNDPDMLEIGNGGMTAAEYRAEFSLWAEMAAPLIAGNDLTTMSPMTRSILTNRAVIEVDQDPLGRQGYAVASAGGLWVLAKPMSGGNVAVVLFNSSNSTAHMSTSAAQVGLPRGSTYRLLDLWSGAEHTTGGPIQATVAAHGVVMFLAGTAG